MIPVMRSVVVVIDIGRIAYAPKEKSLVINDLEGHGTPCPYKRIIFA